MVRMNTEFGCSQMFINFKKQLNMKKLVIGCWLLLVSMSIYSQTEIPVEQISPFEQKQLYAKGKKKGTIRTDEEKNVPCIINGSLSQIPEPVIGEYLEGQTVQFCFTIEEWAFPSTFEWLHSIQVDFGSGWDQSTLAVISVPMDDSKGEWGWYDFWEGCFTGDQFGPGFAFESATSDVSCATGVLDEDPGNNYGYLNSGWSGSASFCWVISVKDCIDNFSEDLSVSVSVYTDYQSGSYDVGTCNENIPYLFDADLICCMDSFGIVKNVQNSLCGDPCTGSVEINLVDTPTIGTTFDFSLADEQGQLVVQCQYCSPPFQADSLCEGSYRVRIENKVTGECTKDEVEITSEQPSNISITHGYFENCNFEDQYLTILEAGLVDFKWIYNDTILGTEALIAVSDIGRYYFEGTTVDGCIRRGSFFVNAVPELQLSISDTVMICKGEELVDIISVPGNDIQNIHWDLTDSHILRVRPIESRAYVAYGEIENANGEICIISKEVYVEVIPIIEMHGLQCQSVAGGVLYTWESIDDGIFTLGNNVLEGETGIFLDNSYLVSNMNPGDVSTVEFFVRNNLSNCIQFYTLSCVAGDCSSAPMINLNVPEEICRGDSPFIIDAEIEGGASGVSIWSGTGISNNLQGLFDPRKLGLPLVSTVKLAWSNDTCSTSVSTLVEMAEEVTDPVINCHADNGVLTFDIQSFNPFSVYDFDVNVLSGQTPVQTGRTIQFFDLVPGEEVDIEVIAFGASNCIGFSELSCSLPCDTLIVPEVSCYPLDDQSLIFEWQEDAFQNYDVNILTGQVGTPEVGQLIVSDLSPGEEVNINLTVSNICGDTQDVTGDCNLDCPDITITIPPAVACQGALLSLEAMIEGGNSNGVYEWTGDCVVDAVNGVIDPDICGLGTYQIILNYTLGTCTYQQSATVEVVAVPDVSFSFAATNICAGEAVVINWDDNGGALFANWDLDGGMIVSENPLMVSWASPGDKMVSLQVVNELGCESTVYNQMIHVKENVELILTCQATTSTINWQWNSIAGTTMYHYELNQNGTITQGSTADNFFVLNNLQPEEQAILTIEAITSEVCSMPATSTCTTINCPDYSLQINAPSSLCDDAGVIQLQAVLEGGDDSQGSYQWAGAGIIDAATGIFDPSVAGVGSYEIMLIYTEDNCIYTASANLQIFDGIGVDIEPVLYVCQNSNYEYCLPEEFNYSWAGPNGFSSQNHCLVFDTSDDNIAGDYTVTVSNETDCVVEQVVQVVEVGNAINTISGPSEVCFYDFFVLSVDVPSSAAVHWFPHENIICSDCPTTGAFIGSDQLFEVHVLDEFGCEWIDSIEVVIGDDCIERGEHIPGNGGSGGSGRSRDDDELLQPLEMLMFPNPVTNNLQLTWKGAEDGQLQMIGIDGKVVVSQMVYDQYQQIDCSQLASGTYFVRLVFPNGVLTERVIVNR